MNISPNVKNDRCFHSQKLKVNTKHYCSKYLRYFSQTVKKKLGKFNLKKARRP